MKVLDPVGHNPWESRRHRIAALIHAASLSRGGLWVEAGVADGWSANQLLGLLPKEGALHLFDSFHGLPADWNAQHPKGTFKTNSVPLFNDPRVLVIAGWYEYSLPAYRAACTRTIDLLHVDCDLYDSAMTVLSELNDRLRPGTIIAFDEAIGSASCEAHEGRALIDWQEKFGRCVIEVARTSYTQLITEVVW